MDKKKVIEPAEGLSEKELKRRRKKEKRKCRRRRRRIFFAVLFAFCLGVFVGIHRFVILAVIRGEKLPKLPKDHISIPFYPAVRRIYNSKYADK